MCLEIILNSVRTAILAAFGYLFSVLRGSIAIGGRNVDLRVGVPNFLLSGDFSTSVGIFVGVSYFFLFSTVVLHLLRARFISLGSYRFLMVIFITVL